SGNLRNWLTKSSIETAGREVEVSATRDLGEHPILEFSVARRKAQMGQPHRKRCVGTAPRVCSAAEAGCRYVFAAERYRLCMFPKLSQSQLETCSETVQAC